MKAESNGVTTIIQPHGWSWVDQPLVGATSDGLNVYAVTVPQSISNCYRYGFKTSLRAQIRGYIDVCERCIHKLLR